MFCHMQELQYSGRRFISPPRDQAKLGLITDWALYPRRHFEASQLQNAYVLSNSMKSSEALKF